MNLRWRLDLILGVALSVWGGWLASAALQDFRAAGHQPSFQQREFAPAVLLACGHGYVEPDEAAAPALAAFLGLRRDRLPCDEISADLARQPLHVFQQVSKYLEVIVGWLWRVRGVNWLAVDALNTVAFSLAIALAFALFRLFAGRVISAIAALLWSLSPLHLTLLPDLRDYIKAPFVLAASFLIVRRLQTQGKRGHGYAIAAACLIAIGGGFRTDVFVMLVALFAALLVSARSTRALAGGLALCGLVFTATAYPILRGYQRGANIAHVVLLGLSTPFDAKLGLQTPAYQIVPVYHDWYVIGLARSWTARHDGAAAGAALQYASRPYDRATGDYLREVVERIPADMLLRTLAATARSVTVMLAPPFQEAPRWLRPSLGGVVQFRARIAGIVLLMLPVTLLLNAIALLSRGWRITIGGAVLALLFPVASVLQFHERHVFYLEVLSLASAASALTAFTRALVERRGARHSRDAAVLTFAAVTAATLLIASVLFSARYIQRARLERLFTEYRDMPTAVQPWHAEPQNDGQTLLVADRSRSDVGAPVNVLRFDRLHCDSALFRATVRYRTRDPVDDFSFPIWIDLTRTPQEDLFFPAVDAPALGVVFAGLELPAEASACVRMWSVGQPARGVPSLIAALSPDGAVRPLWQRLRQSVSGIPDGDGYVYLNRPERAVPTAMLSGGDSTLTRLPATRPNAYLFVGNPREVVTGAGFAVEGTSGRGDFSIGLQQEDRWTDVVTIDASGPFKAFLLPQRSGTYRAVVAAGPGAADPEIKVVRAGWVSP